MGTSLPYWQRANRFVTRRNHRLAFFDPMVHLPNLRALNRDNAMVSALLFACSGHGATGKELRHYAAYPVQAKTLTVDNATVGTG